MRKYFATFLRLTAIFLLVNNLTAQPADGVNEYRLAAVNPKFLGSDTLDTDAGRGIWVAHDPDLDGDGKPEILITEYADGGRVFVFEVIGNDLLEFVWASPKLTEGRNGGGQTPRSITTGDFDNDGNQEIIFQIGYFANDSVEFAQRGIYFYEHTGADNDYGTEAAFKLTFEAIDSSFAMANVGRTENGLRVQDIDGDGKNELLFPPRSFFFSVAKLYILEVESGTFENGDVVIENEFTYEDMVMPPGMFGDGFVPVGTEIGDVDADGFDEIIVAGWTNIGRGAGIGFIQIDGADSYTPGSVVPVTSEFSAFQVKGKPLFTTVNGSPVIYLHGSDGSTSHMWVVDGILADSFVDASNIKEVFTDVGFWGAWDLGDQDHPTNSAGDGLDLYLYGGSGRLLDVEYNGTGDVADSSSYTVTQIYDLADAYDNIGGLFNDVYTFPGMDLDMDGNRDIVASYKGSGIDSLGGELFTQNTFGLFFFEFGDSTQSLDLITSIDPKPWTIITPEDYFLEQNYPNPFNPTTQIVFDLPINKTVSLKIYNSLGQEVRTLINNQPYPVGRHTVQWDATDNRGNRAASGVYIYKLIFGNFSKSKTMTLIR